ncbi:hypothetical protein RPALISO_219 [Ruegeria phage RpAliso]|nr:hypothetical protein RPALISO_219 [Ruegeria phage RpAliso]
MTAQARIAQFFTFIERDVDFNTKRIEMFAQALLEAPADMGARSFEDVTEKRWALDACTYVMGSKDDIVDLYSFELLRDSLVRDMLAYCAQMGMRRYEHAAYWKQLGRIEQEATRLISAIKAQESKVDA